MIKSMDALNEQERYLVEKIESARRLIQPDIDAGDASLDADADREDMQVRNFALQELINTFRSLYMFAISSNVDPAKVAAALGIPPHMVDEGGVIKLGAVLVEWFGNANALTLMNLLARWPLPEYPEEIKAEPENTLNPAISIKVQTEQRGSGKGRRAGEPGEERKTRNEATIDEVLGDLMLAFDYAGVTLTEGNHTHYALNDDCQTHVIDLHEHDLRIVVTNKLHSTSRNTYVTSQPFEPETGITPDWQSYPGAKAIQKYENHAIKVAQAIKRFILGEGYDGCVNVDGTEASDCTGVSDGLIRMCDRPHLEAVLLEIDAIPIIHYNSAKCADIYSKKDILRAVARVLGYSSIEELEKLQIVETDENGIAEVETDGETKKVISLLPLGKQMGYARANALASYMLTEGIEPLKYIKGLSRSKGNLKVDLYPYKEAVAVLTAKMFGMDPFKTEIEKIDWQTATIELGGRTYVIPEVDLYNKVEDSAQRRELGRRFHEDNAGRHNKETLALIKARGFLRLYPLDDTYRKFMRDSGLAS